MITNSNPAWRASVRSMRLLCPLGVIAAAAVGYLDWSYERYELMAVAAFCGGVSTMLTWIQWRWFSI